MSDGVGIAALLTLIFLSAAILTMIFMAVALNHKRDNKEPSLLSGLAIVEIALFAALTGLVYFGTGMPLGKVGGLGTIMVSFSFIASVVFLLLYFLERHQRQLIVLVGTFLFVVTNASTPSVVQFGSKVYVDNDPVGELNRTNITLLGGDLIREGSGQYLRIKERFVAHHRFKGGYGTAIPALLENDDPNIVNISVATRVRHRVTQKPLFKFNLFTNHIDRFKLDKVFSAVVLEDNWRAQEKDLHSVYLGDCNVDWARELMKRGAAPDQYPGYGKPILIRAIFSHCDEVVSALIEAGAEVNIKGSDGELPLNVAVSRNALNVVKELLAHGADPSLCRQNIHGREWSALHNAARKTASLEILRTLLRAGASPNNSCSAEGGRDTPLHVAAKANTIDAVDALLKFGADASLRNSEGYSAADLVRRRPHACEVLRHLAKVTVDELNTLPEYSSGISSLVAAVRANSDERVAKILLSGVNPNLANSRRPYGGSTPLHIALEKGHFSNAALLLEHKADPNVIDSKGQKPLDVVHEVSRTRCRIYDMLSQ